MLLNRLLSCILIESQKLNSPFNKWNCLFKLSYKGITCYVKFIQYNLLIFFIDDLETSAIMVVIKNPWRVVFKKFLL